MLHQIILEMKNKVEDSHLPVSELKYKTAVIKIDVNIRIDIKIKGLELNYQK